MNQTEMIDDKLFRATTRYLRQIQRLNEKINTLIAERSRTQLLMGSIGAVDYARDRVQGAPERALENSIARLDDYDQKINAAVDVFVDVKLNIVDRLNAMGDYRARQVLVARYIDAMTAEQAAVNLHIDYRWLMRLHARGIREFAAANTPVIMAFAEKSQCEVQ